MYPGLRLLLNVRKASPLARVPPVLSRGFKSKEVQELDEGLKLGDYPNLPWISAQERPPKGWWDNQDRRNKEDPLHEQDDILNMWICNHVENNGRYTKYQALGQLLAMFGFLGCIYGLAMWKSSRTEPVAVPRQFPYNNLYLSRGGNPNKTPPTKPERIHTSYGQHHC